MIFLNSFLLGGTICLIGQLILDNTKLTPGHITSTFTVLGAILSFFGIYDDLITNCGAGATMPISNFGHLLYQGAYNGYHENGFLGLFNGLLNKCSLAITVAVIVAFLCTLLFKPKD